MPRSKHRHKAGGKSVARPGQHRAVRELPVTAAEVAWRKFRDAYLRPFHKRWPAHDAGFMLDIISNDIFDPDEASFRPASKKAVFNSFLEPGENEEGSVDALSPDQADAALDFLIQEEMIVVDGEVISVHPRFKDVMTWPLAHDGAREGQDPISSESKGD
jgi:hypothetical protein